MDTRLCDLRISAMVTTVVTARPRPLSSIMLSVSRNFLLRVRKKLSGRFSRDTWMRRHWRRSATAAGGAAGGAAGWGWLVGVDMWEWEGGGDGNGGLGCGCGGDWAGDNGEDMMCGHGDDTGATVSYGKEAAWWDRTGRGRAGSNGRIFEHKNNE